jgi:hypothetical protein
VTVAAQENTKIVEPRHDALQLDAVDEENREGNFALTNVIEKSVLEVLSAICGHVSLPLIISLFTDFVLVAVG